jgi:hypothetical protein
MTVPSITIYFRFILVTCIVISSSVAISQNNTIPLNGKRSDAPPALVILPFDNATHTNDIAPLFRHSLANHLHSKNYRDLKLTDTDQALDILSHSLGKQWKTVTPQDLGKLFHCDFLLYGEVNKFSRIFLGIYAHLALGVNLRLVETNYGQVIWEMETTMHSREGGVPFSPFGLIPDFLRCSLHLTEEKKLNLIEKTCREMIEKIPNPPSQAVSVFIVELQVASFTRREHAETALKELKAKGYDARMEKVALAHRKWYRIILGPYYDRSEAEMVKKALGSDLRYRPIFIHY